MPKLSLAVLGPFQASLDGQPLSGLTSAKARALLVYLAVESDRAHSREVLAALLSPDYEAEAALLSLRQALLQLRRVFVAQQAQPSLLVTRDTIQLNPAGEHWIDLAAFRALLTSDESGGGEVERLEQAVGLYRGDFLQGFAAPDSPAFEDWVVVQREELARRALSALQRLAQAYESRGELDRAEGCLRRQLSIEPTREEAHRELMRLLALEGQRSAALAQFETCKRLLKDELGVEPARETLALYSAIRDGALPLDSLAFATKPDLRAAPPASSASQAPETAPLFVARERELARLDSHLSAALRGQGRVAFVAGEAGSGKTALMAEFARRAMRRHGDLVVALGSCNAQTGVGDPYLPFRDLLQMLSSDVEAKRAADSISPEHARRLWSLLPECLQALVDSGPDLLDLLVPARSLLARAQALGPSGGASLGRLERLLQRKTPRPATQQADLFEQVTRVLQALSRRHPLVLVLDDLQWADRGSIGLLFHLGRRLAGSRLLVLGAYRRDDVALGRGGERHPLEQVVNELGRDAGDHLLNLDQAEGRRLIDELLDAEPNRLGEGFRESLYRRTEGHALFTVELIRGLEERGDLVRDESGAWVEGGHLDWGRLPGKVEAAIGERIGRLPTELQRLLEVASVEGEEFTAEVVARVCGADEREVSHALSGELSRVHRLVVAKSLRRVDGQRLSLYRFRHQLFQQYLYNQLDDVERAELHEGVGLALEESRGEAAGEIAVQLARHFEIAGLVEKALGYLLKAGGEATQVAAYVEAIQHLDRGLALLRELPRSAERDRWEASLQLALASPLLAVRGWGSPELARAVARADELCRRTGETGRLAKALGLLSNVATGQGRCEEAVSYAERLLAIAERTHDQVEAAHGHVLMASALTISGNFIGALEHFDRAMELLGSAEASSTAGQPARELRIYCLSWQAVVLSQAGYPDKGLEQNHRALAEARLLGDPLAVSFVVASLVSVYIHRREVQAARDLMELVTHSQEGRESLHMTVPLEVARGALKVRGGEVESGIGQMLRAIDEWRATGTVALRPIMLHLTLETCWEAGQTEIGLAVAEEALAVAQQGARSQEAEVHRLKGELLLQRGGVGDEAAAESCFRRALEVARRQGAKPWELRAATSLARLWQRQGRVAEAHDLLAPVYAWFTEGFETQDLKDARSLLGSVHH